jgi:hypothetical protein
LNKRAGRGFNKQIFGADEQVSEGFAKRLKGMSIYEYHIVINDAQRRLIMRALTNALANDRHSTEALRPMPYEWMQLYSAVWQGRKASP